MNLMELLMFLSFFAAIALVAGTWAAIQLYKQSKEQK